MCLYLCFENTGAVSLIPNGGDINMILIKDPQQVINAPTTALKDEEIFGGSFFNKIKKGLSVANNFAKKTGIISKLSKYILNYCNQISSLAEKYGYRIQGYGTGGALNYEGGALKYKRRTSCAQSSICIKILVFNKLKNYLRSEKTPQ